MCWDVTELVVLYLRDRKKGMPPGAHVGVHLFIWAGFACGLGWEARIFAIFECYSADCAKRTASQWGGTWDDADYRRRLHCGAFVWDSSLVQPTCSGLGADIF